MMTLTRTRIGLGLAATALAVGLGTPFVTAQDNNTNTPPPPFMGRGGPGRGGPGRGGPLALPELRGLDLTETQRTEVRALQEAAEVVVSEVRTKLRQDVMTLLTDEQKAQIAARPAPPDGGGRGLRGRPPGPAH
jgi:Spy/CpxP family protein refolding chaperone